MREVAGATLAFPISPAFWTSSAQVLAARIRGDVTGLEDASEQNEQEAILY
jgi:hypothetical protein